MSNPIQELRYQVGEAWKGTYNSATVYGNANVVQDAAGLSVYRSLKPGNVGHPLSDTNWWFCIIDMSSIKNLRDQMQQDDQTATEHEAARVEAEAGRVSAEQARVNAESARVQAEQTRDGNESTRIQQEQTRVNQEASRVQAEQGRVNAENARVLAEQGRVTAEQSRVMLKRHALWQRKIAVLFMPKTTVWLWPTMSRQTLTTPVRSLTTRQP
jgi:hypothetical protein